MSGPLHLLLAVTADGNALPLVESACRLSSSMGATWSVVAIDTPASEGRAPARRGALLRALDRAQHLGATVTRISTGSNTRSAVVSSLVHRAISEGATTLMIGHQRVTHRIWPHAETRLGDFTGVLSQLLPGVTVHLVCPPDEEPGQSVPSAAPGRAWYLLRDWHHVLLALCACTGAGAVLEPHVHPANIVMIYLAGVVYVASRVGQAPAVATVLGSIFLYDLIFVQPRWSLKPTEPQYWLAFLVMMVVGLIISRLAARAREHALLAETRAQRTQSLNQLSVALGRARDRDAVAQSLCAAVRSSVGSASSLLFVDAPGGDLLPGQQVLPGFDAHWSQRALAGRVEVGAGTAVGSSQPLRYLPLVAGDTAFGLLVLTPPDPQRDTLEDQHLIRALASQAAIALERAELERRSIAAAVAAEGERTRNTLLAGISHDFRTPLTTIVGSATLLLEQAPAIDEARRNLLLQGLLDEARRLHELTSNLLDLTRLDEGAIQLRPEWCPADELLESARRQLEPRLQQRSLIVGVPDDALVWCDARLIDQLLVNLLDNAVRHTAPSGTIRVAVAVSSSQWTLTVHDDGAGIAPGQERAIFRKFHRAAGDGDSMGKGLGLAICDAIATLHGGSIVAENAAGARFTLVLPQPAPPELEQGEP